MIPDDFARLVSVLATLTLVGCGANSPQTPDAKVSDASLDATAPTTTIAAARQSFSGTASALITVNAVVTAVQGTVGDQVIWYIEDPTGGPYSGISVYCDPLAATTCPCKAGCTPHVAAPPLHTLTSITGSITTYHGQLQLEPTAQTILQMNASPPPVYVASTSDVAETATSPYQGVYVKFESTAIVNNLTPTALYDSQCNPMGLTTMPPPLCSGCSPPTYAGFEVNGPGAGAFLVEETFFPFVPLQNSPECLTQPGAVAVTQGETFSSIAGILDVDPYAMKQVLSPVQPSDYGQ